MSSPLTYILKNHWHMWTLVALCWTLPPPWCLMPALLTIPAALLLAWDLKQIEQHRKWVSARIDRVMVMAERMTLGDYGFATFIQLKRVSLVIQMEFDRSMALTRRSHLWRVWLWWELSTGRTEWGQPNITVTIEEMKPEDT